VNGPVPDDAKPASRGEKPSVPVVVGAGRPSRQAPIAVDTRIWPARITSILAAAGLVLLVVAWTHVLVMFIPAHFGIAAWEFTVASQAVDVMPLAIAGMAFLAVAGIAGGWKRRLFFVAAWCVVTALALIAVAALLLLDLPIAWRSVMRNMQQDLAKTAGKAIGFTIVFAVFHLWLAFWLTAAARAKKRVG
jgi:hypothetical protein